MKQVIDLIKQKHKEAGIDINPPARLSEISNFERKMGFSLPADFRKFYLTCNGFGCNEDIFNIVPLSEVREYHQNFGDKLVLFF